MIKNGIIKIKIDRVVFQRSRYYKSRHLAKKMTFDGVLGTPLRKLYILCLIPPTMYLEIDSCGIEIILRFLNLTILITTHYYK
jgi:hypothetical protein